MYNKPWASKYLLHSRAQASVSNQYEGIRVRALCVIVTDVVTGNE